MSEGSACGKCTRVHEQLAQILPFRVLEAAEGKLAEANRTVEQLKQLVPGVDLLKNPSKLMPVSEAVKMVKEVLPAPMIQRSWGLGPQRMCQDLQRVVQKLETRAGKN